LKPEYFKKEKEKKKKNKKAAIKHNFFTLCNGNMEL
jgi:alpha-D-ribose 1-methylphosphonate 5-triphosphate synthase subunit PhnG